MKEQSIKLKKEGDQPYEIPEGGSLGLLALGYVGIMLWREKRHEIQLKRQELTLSNEKT